MKRANISQLRNKLSEFLDHVRAGGRVVILDRERPIAEIVPLSTEYGGASADRDLLAALVREGSVRDPGRSLPAEFLRDKPPGKGAGVLKALLEERESGR